MGGAVCIPIPDTSSEGTPSLVWPARPGVPRDCYCPPYENDVELTKFSYCYVTCDTTYSIHSFNGSICFSNLTSAMNNTSVHFVTLTQQCNFPKCFIRTTVGSYKIMVYDDQEEITSDSDTEPTGNAYNIIHLCLLFSANMIKIQ